MTNSCPDLLIAGASARAATFSALRGGLVVAAADLFVDRDLAAVADATAISHWPDDIERWAGRFPSSVPFLYTGGLENHPKLLTRIGRHRRVAGNLGKPLDAVRSPELLREILSACDVRMARLGGQLRASDARWLLKPRRGAGGRGIRVVPSECEVNPSEEYLQEFVSGTAGSAAFLVHANGNAELIGVCESLRGLDPSANPFAYYGSIARRDWTSDMLERAGRALANVGLRGLFGVDFIRQSRGGYVVVEVNPRFTASMELYEMSTGRSLIAEHLNACGVSPRPFLSVGTQKPNDAVFGKRIVYAPHHLTCDLAQAPTIDEIHSGAYVLADLPQRGVTINAATPVCTVVASADDVAKCRIELEQRERAVMARCQFTGRT